MLVIFSSVRAVGGFPLLKEAYLSKKNILLKGNQSFAIRPKTSKELKTLFCDTVNIFFKSC